MQDHSGLYRSQFSIYYPLHLASAEDARIRQLLARADKPLVHAFLTSVGNTLLPTPNVEGSIFRVYLSPPDPRSINLVEHALSPSTHRADLVNGLWSFLRSCVWSVLIHGSSSYEIVYVWEGRSGKVLEFELTEIPFGSLRWEQGIPIQTVPKKLAQQYRIPRRIRLDADRVVTFTPPMELQSVVRRTIENLDILSDRSTLVTTSIQQGSLVPFRHFDWDTYRRTDDAALAEATAVIGWTPSGRLFNGTDDDRILEYYWWRRKLRLERFKVLMRDHLIGTLNEILRRAGTRLRVPMKLETEGLPTLKDVEEAQKHLEAGDRTFSEIFKSFQP